ncbi:MAG: DUF4810 domain-containing protein [Prevotellaceae bacterium]|jgi:hypothetical protein|nr:DUF4810 domain-containing protein [Prevotellaceae bacterium]
MKIIFFGLLAILFFTSCRSPQALYSWDNYDETSYTYLKRGDEKSMNRLLKTYQQLIKRSKGTRRTVPPGIYADYGFLLLQTGKIKEGKAMMEKEMTLYPESKVFINRILKRFEK